MSVGARSTASDDKASGLPMHSALTVIPDAVSRYQPGSQRPIAPGQALVDFHGEVSAQGAVEDVGAHPYGLAAGSDGGGSTCRTGGRRRGASPSLSACPA